jgi:hypothetical protein
MSFRLLIRRLMLVVCLLSFYSRVHGDLNDEWLMMMFMGEC